MRSCRVLILLFSQIDGLIENGLCFCNVVILKKRHVQILRTWFASLY